MSFRKVSLCFRSTASSPSEPLSSIPSSTNCGRGLEPPAYLYVDRKLHLQALQHFDGVDPGDHRALVVAGAPAEQLPVLLHQLEGLGVPAVGLVRGLHVQVPVDQQRLLALVLAQSAEEHGRQSDLAPVVQDLSAVLDLLALHPQGGESLKPGASGPLTHLLGPVDHLEHILAPGFVRRHAGDLDRLAQSVHEAGLPRVDLSGN